MSIKHSCEKINYFLKKLRKTLKRGLTMCVCSDIINVVKKNSTKQGGEKIIESAR